MRVLVIATLAAGLVAACGGSSATPAPSALTFGPGQNSQTDFAGGQYRVSWDAGGCTNWEAWIAPTSGQDVPLPVTDGTGSANVEIPAGTAFVNSTASCPGSSAWRLTVARP